MRRRAALAALLAALAFAGSNALAFQEVPPAPSVEPSDGPAGHRGETTPQSDSLRLGTPQASEIAKPEQGGLELFGYTLMPNLNFGLDLLYGQDGQQQQLQLQGKDQNLPLENGDVSVLGKVKRRF